MFATADFCGGYLIKDCYVNYNDRTRRSKIFGEMSLARRFAFPSTYATRTSRCGDEVESVVLYEWVDL